MKRREKRGIKLIEREDEVEEGEAHLISFMSTCLISASI